MLRKTFHLCLVLAVSFVAFAGMRNCENIQISHEDIEGVILHYQDDKYLFTHFVHHSSFSFHKSHNFLGVS